MPMIQILVLQSDYDAAERIARKMFPESPNTVNAEGVLATAANMGMAMLRTEWNDTEDQVNAYADAKIRSDKLHRDDGRPDGDLNTYGTKLEPGT